MLRLMVIFSCLSLLCMTLIDRAIGARAEFLNAWSVIERLLGRTPSAGESLVALRLGAFGEFVAVLVANVAVGAFLAFAVRLTARQMR